MSTFGFICAKVEKIIEKYDDTDPFRLCKEMGIIVRFMPLGDNENACKGFFLAQSRIRCITINNSLSSELQRVICAHELGHAVLHKKCAGIKEFHDFALFDAVNAYEYEANIFAAELLLPDEDVLDTLHDDMSFFQAASILYVPAEMLDFKFKTLRWKGYDDINSPLCTKSNFLKNVNDIKKPLIF